MGTVRLTMAQALVRFLANQYVERDGMEQRFFQGCFGIFGHGNVAGMGQALQQYADRRTGRFTESGHSAKWPEAASGVQSRP